MEKNTKFLCEHCEVVAEHELLLAMRGKGVIEYISVCSVCMSISFHKIKAEDAEIKKIEHVHFLCGGCHMRVRGKIISEKEENAEYRGKREKYVEVTVQCSRCHKKTDLTI